MKQKLISALIVGLIAVIVVIISDLFATLSLGSFAWIAFVLWNFTSKGTDAPAKPKQVLNMIIGIPIGLLLAIGMIHGPALFQNNVIAKYTTVFLCNGIAVCFPGNIIPAIFFGIGLTFSGLGVGMVPNNLKTTAIMLGIMLMFAILGMLAAWSVEKLQQKINKK